MFVYGSRHLFAPRRNRRRQCHRVKKHIKSGHKPHATSLPREKHLSMPAPRRWPGLGAERGFGQPDQQDEACKNPAQ